VTDRQIRSALMLVGQALQGLGIDPPDPYTAELADIDGWADAAGTLIADRRQLAEAVAAAIADGRDPTTCKKVAAALTGATLARENIGQAVADLAADRRAAVLARHAPALHAALAAEVGRIDTALATAREAVGPAMARALTDHTAALASLRPQQLGAWGEAREQVARLGTVVQAWRQLTTATGTAAPTGKTAALLLVVADLDAPTLDRLVRDHGTDPTAPAIAGVELSLADPDTFAERQAKIAQQRDEQQRQRDQAAKNQLRRASGNFAA
jgi:hypothetical protein